MPNEKKMTNKAVWLRVCCMAFFLLPGILAILPDAGAQNMRGWSEGPLTWNDIVLSKDTQYVYSFYASLYTQRAYEKRNDTLFRYYHTEAVILEDHTRIDPDFRTIDNLRLFQLLFDQAELERRKFHRRLHGDSRVNYYWLERASLDEISRKVSNYIEASFPVPDPDMLDQWEQNTDNMLRVGGGDPIPAFRAGEWGAGFHMGIGIDQYTGRAANHFSTAFHLGLGFDLIYRNWYLLPYYTVGFNSVLEEMEDYPAFEKGTRNASLMFAAAIGYRVTDLPRWTVVPFAGVSHYYPGSIQVGDDNEYVELPAGNNLIAGVSVDRKFRHIVDFGLLSNFRQRKYSHNAVRFRLFGMYTHADHLFSGMSVHFALAFLTTGRRIYVE